MDMYCLLGPTLVPILHKNPVVPFIVLSFKAFDWYRVVLYSQRKWNIINSWVPLTLIPRLKKNSSQLYTRWLIWYDRENDYNKVSIKTSIAIVGNSGGEQRIMTLVFLTFIYIYRSVSWAKQERLVFWFRMK